MPCPQLSGYFWKQRLRPHVIGVFRHKKRRFSKTVSRVEFLKTPVYPFRLEGRKRKFSNTMISFIIQHMACKEYHLYFHCSRVYVWTEENDSNTLRADGYFFSKTEKKICVFKNIRILAVDRAWNWKRKRKTLKGLLHLSFHLKVFFVKFDFHEA